jgi:hypothetical protein
MTEDEAIALRARVDALNFICRYMMTAMMHGHDHELVVAGMDVMIKQGEIAFPVKPVEVGSNGEASQQHAVLARFAIELFAVETKTAHLPSRTPPAA